MYLCQLSSATMHFSLQPEELGNAFQTATNFSNANKLSCQDISQNNQPFFVWQISYPNDVWSRGLFKNKPDTRTGIFVVVLVMWPNLAKVLHCTELWRHYCALVFLACSWWQVSVVCSQYIGQHDLAYVLCICA